MQRYIASRIAQGIITLFLVTTVVFFLSRLTGNPADLLLPFDAAPAERERIIENLGLDGSVLEQYKSYMGSLLQGDFGRSLRSKVESLDLYMQRLPATLTLGLAAALFTVIVAVPLGILAALYRGTIIDSVARVVTTFGLAVPGFWLGLMLIHLVGVQLRWLPAGGKDDVSSYVLPAVALGISPAAGLGRLIRSSMIDAMDSDYVKMLRIKGLPEWRVVFQHALRNASIAPITFIGQFIALFLGGTVVVEAVFAWPGVGRLAFEAIITRDYPVAQAVILFNAFIIVSLNLVVDLLYVYLNPRIRYES